MSVFVRQHPAKASLRRRIVHHSKKVVVLVAVSLWIPWTLACGASAQGSGPAEGTARSTLQLDGQLPAGVVQQSYSGMLSVTGGRAPYHFALGQGTLPLGLTLAEPTGRISGTPALAGEYSFTVRVVDASLHDEGIAQFHVSVGPQQGGFGSIHVTVEPSSLTLTSKATQTFLAVLQGTSNTAVTWTASAGEIGANGLFTAPAVSVQTTVTILATSVADPTKQASAIVTVEPAASSQPLSIQTSSLQAAEAGQSYQATLKATGGKAPYSWSLSGSLPAGISLSTSGSLSGTAQTSGTSTFTVKVSDAASHTAQQQLSLAVSSSSGNFDGPAELPRVYVDTAFSDTPATGKSVTVSTLSDLQAAITNASCGDTIEIQAGVALSGSISLPAKPCDDQHWIVLRTSAPDSALPPEGQRLTPCYAGVASLPGRPAYPCSNPQNVLAKLSVAQGRGVSGPIILQQGANHYRLIGLEITRLDGIGAVAALISSANQATVDHLIVDRSWVHGNAREDTRRGVEMRAMSYVAVIDSYMNDFHCTALTGSCVDSQTVGSGGGTTPNGPYKITDNFLEAASENILFGGSGATYPPSDIEISHNHFFKPLQWKSGNAGYVGGTNNNPFIVKNHIELKNAVRLLIEANIFENTWGGFSQSGNSILFTARNNFDQTTNQYNCSNCQVTDVTFRLNRISHVAGGIVIYNLLVGTKGAAAGARFSIHDVVIDDVSAQRYNGGGGMALVGNGWPTNVLNNVSFSHITAFPDSTRDLLVIGNSRSHPQMSGFTFADSVVVVPQYPVWSVGGYADDCAISDVPVESINTCFSNNNFSHNVLIATPPHYTPSMWPAGNFFAPTVASVGFANYANGNGGDYTLTNSSPYKGKASDGTDPGAGIAALNQALAGVE